jgi:hypothetical protein
MNWKEVWLDNYNGNSEAAKSLESMMKKNYKQHKYIPWATMVRWLYLLDPEATLEVVRAPESGFVHTSRNNIHTDKTHLDVKKLEDTKDNIFNVFLAHFVVLKCTFLGKTFEEVYPIQDNAYNAPNYYDSNMVNKSIQRAKAKLISTATGLAFRLYEDGDLQFEDDDEKPKQTTPIKATETKPPKKETVADVVSQKDTNTSMQVTDDVTGIVDLILENKEDILPILKMSNVEIVKTYNFQLSTEDSREVLLDKVKQFKNAKIFYNMLKRRLEDKKGSK